jgi:membrane-bound metal-dependent hydrolase YbcI (DUF457 family)
MLPHGHLAVGYLVYTACTRGGAQTSDQTDLLVLLIATQMPDLIDKPLVLAFSSVFPGGRTVGHSMLVAVPVVLVVGRLITRQTDHRRPALAFAVGYLTHPLGDAAPLMLQGSLVGDLREVSFLWWPFNLPVAAIVAALTEVPIFGTIVGAKAAWTAATLPRAPVLNTGLRVVEVCLLALAGALWVRAGAPGTPWRDR